MKPYGCVTVVLHYLTEYTGSHVNTVEFLQTCTGLH